VIRGLLRAAALTAGAGAACVGYGTFVESASYRVRRAALPVLDPGTPPLRVLHFSDVHLLAWQARRKAFLRGLADLAPDLVVSTGDNLSNPDAVGALTASLGPLLEVPGAFVFGSNDYHRPSVRNPLGYLWASTATDRAEARRMRPEELSAALARHGWLDLDNARAELVVRGVRLELRGTGDAHESRDDYAAVGGPPAPGAVPLGLTHAPYGRILDAMARDGVRCVFAGHTHGGQVCVPGWGALTSNCDLDPKLAKGVHRHVSADGAPTWVNVSAGVGMSPYAPFRFACPPEVSVVTLVSRAE